MSGSWASRDFASAAARLRPLAFDREIASSAGRGHRSRTSLDGEAHPDKLASLANWDRPQRVQARASMGGAIIDLRDGPVVGQPKTAQRSAGRISRCPAQAVGLAGQEDADDDRHAPVARARPDHPCLQAR